MTMISPFRGEILGLGIDLVDLSRFAGFLARHQDALHEVFTASELAAAGSSRQRELYLATRWALKEACLKALGSGWAEGTRWTDVEALGDLLTPRIGVQGEAREIARGLGAGSLVGAAARSGEVVIAIAVLAGGEPVTAP